MRDVALTSRYVGAGETHLILTPKSTGRVALGGLAVRDSPKRPELSVLPQNDATYRSIMRQKSCNSQMEISPFKPETNVLVGKIKNNLGSIAYKMGKLPSKGEDFNEPSEENPIRRLRIGSDEPQTGEPFSLNFRNSIKGPTKTANSYNASMMRSSPTSPAMVFNNPPLTARTVVQPSTIRANLNRITEKNSVSKNKSFVKYETNQETAGVASFLEQQSPNQKNAQVEYLSSKDDMSVHVSEKDDSNLSPVDSKGRSKLSTRRLLEQRSFKFYIKMQGIREVPTSSLQTSLPNSKKTKIDGHSSRLGKRSKFT
jgi:hypothetical protein